MRILFFPKYTSEGASSRYRTYQYIPFFKENGISCTILPFFDSSHIDNLNSNKKKSIFSFLNLIFRRTFQVLKIKKGTLVFIEKELVPYFPPVLEYYLKIRRISYVLDYDDAIIHNYDQSSKSIIRQLFSNKIPKIQSWATSVVNGSLYLNNQSLRNNPNSFYIPTSLDLQKYPVEKTLEKEKFIVGWIGSSSTSKLVIPFVESIEEFCKKYNAEVHLIGFDKQLYKTLNSDFFKLIEWTDQNETSNINAFDVGIAPTIDSPFIRGKCAFKAIQYMACSKPVITTPIGANKDVVIHNNTGYHANSDLDWFKYLEFLYLNPQKVIELGKNGRIRAEKEFTIQVNYSKYIDIFSK